MLVKEESFVAIIKEEKPSYNRGDKVRMTEDKGARKVTVRSIYSRKLEDLTFNDLKMMGYSNPNLFVREWDKRYGSFDSKKTVWVVVYLRAGE